MGLRTVVVDDEQLAREELCYLLGHVEDVEVVGQAANGVDGVRVIDELDPDLALLDVQMPGLTGFEVARELLKRQARSHIVFVTAFDRHALEAFEVNAVDYLLKPVEGPRLELAVERVRRRVTSAQPSVANRELERLVALVTERQTRRERVAVKVGERFVLIQADDIIYVSMIDDAITIVTSSLVGTSNHRTLDELQAHLNPAVFWAGASLAPGQHQQDQGNRALVQPKLHSENEGRKGHRDPGEPVANQTLTRVSELMTESVPPSEPNPWRAPAWPSPPRPDQPSEDAADGGLRLSLERATAEARTGDGVPEDGSQARALPPPPTLLAKLGEELVAWLKTLASAAVYATLIVTFGFQVARVEGQSMAPTLADQDRLIVNKLAYRLGEPRRSDIVMLYYPLNPDKSFVKRVIAEESDTVRIDNGQVFVNDVPVRDEYVPPDYRSHEDYGPQIVPEGYYFVMGDHRNNSSDSRHWGMVPKKYIIGRVQLRWWPIPTARLF